MAEAIGQTFSHFRIEEELHRGPTAVTYRAFDPVLERRVLLKVLRTGVGIDEIRHEAMAYAKLQHPNIVSLYHFDEWEGKPYLVLEFVDGQSLAQLLADRGALPVPVALCIARDLFQALAYAHERGVLHRDVKPSNVLLSRDGWVKLGDFGLALLKKGNGEGIARGIAGTPAYLAPELLRGQAATDRSDLFSAGATLYEMLCGHRLITEEDGAACLRAIARGQWEPLEKRRPDVPRDLAELVDKLLEPDPSNRPTSAGAVVDRIERIARAHGHSLRSEVLRQFLASEPVKSAAPRARPRLARRTAAIAGAGLFLVFAAIAIWLLQQSSSPTLRSAETGIEVTRQGPLAAPPDTASVQPTAVRPEQKKPAVERRQTTPVKPAPSQPPGVAAWGKGPAQPDATAREKAPVQLSLLHVACSPWGEVEVDGALLGTTPPLGQLELSPGSHTVVFRHPEFPACSLRVQLVPGASETLRVNMWARVAQLELEVTPWAGVWIDGDSVDTTPIAKPLILAPGEHEIELRNPGYAPWKHVIRALPGSRIKLKVSMATGEWELVQ